MCTDQILKTAMSCVIMDTYVLNSHCAFNYKVAKRLTES